MKLTILILLLVILAVIIAMSVYETGEKPAPAQEPEPTPSEPAPIETESPVPEAAKDAETTFTTLIDGEVENVTMAAYLPGVVAAEMPAGFDMEALKSQAVAARTYILWSMARENASHPEADVCADFTCCKAWLNPEELSERWGANYEGYWERICGAVIDTDGIYLAWAGEPIMAAFHSSSNTQTEDAGNIWSSRPYLVSVSSPETADDVPKYVTTVEVTAENLSNTLRAAYPEASFEGAADAWLSSVEYNASGRVDSASVGGISIPGTTMRTLFSLRSTAFTLEWTGECFLFTVTGYGHGVGMSQYGANTMALAGSSFDEILLHYYVGAELIAP